VSAHLSHSGNVLGALTIALDDRIGDSTGLAAGGPRTAAAALSSLADFLDAPTIGRLQQVLGLTPSGTVRLVDGLEGRGLVTRSAIGDGRKRRVSLTPAGRRAATAVRSARAEVLESALSALSYSERQTLDDLVSKILTSLRREPGAVRWTCRLCDTGTCGRAEGRCPFSPSG
jgi:MarR family transcriptional repressor of emrRAB